MSKNNKIAKQYFNVVTSDDAGVGEILLYGVIGQEYWWRDSDEDDITDLAFVKALRAMEKKHDRINIRINSPGGSIFHGNAIIAAMKNSKAEIHTYNDGLAASMGFGIWLAGEVRHMNETSLAMAHSASTITFGNAKDHQETIDLLNKIDQTLINNMASSSGKTKEYIQENFFDHSDHYLNAEDCKELGLINKVDDYKTEEEPKNFQNMSYKEIMNHFNTPEKEAPQSFFQQIANVVTDVFKNNANPPAPKADISNNKTQSEMNIEDLKSTLGSDELPVADVINALVEGGHLSQPTNEAPPADPPAEETPALTPKDLTDAIKPLQDKITALENSAGAPPTKVISNGDAPTEPQEPDALDVFNTAANQAANGNSVVSFAK